MSNFSIGRWIAVAMIACLNGMEITSKEVLTLPAILHVHLAFVEIHFGDFLPITVTLCLDTSGSSFFFFYWTAA